MIQNDGEVLKPMRYRLDTVNDCADLQDTFPENVSFKFVYHEHGREGHKREITDPLAPYLSGVEHVAFESASSPYRDPVMFEKEVKRASDSLHHTGAYLVAKAVSAIGRHSTATVEIRNMAKSIKAIDGVVPKSFFAVDVYANPFPKIDYTSFSHPLNLITLIAARDRVREATTIRQLHDKAHEISQDDKTHDIAVVYGSQHTLLSVAMHVLGAKVQRYFVNRPGGSFRPIDAVQQSHRFLVGQQKLNEIDSIYIRSLSAAGCLEDLAEQLNIPLANPNQLRLDATNLFGLYVRHALPTNKDELVVSFESLASTFLTGEQTVVNPNQVQKLEATVRRLVALLEDPQD